jgi:hypothetical protein
MKGNHWNEKRRIAQARRWILDYWITGLKRSVGPERAVLCVLHTSIALPLRIGTIESNIATDEHNPVNLVFQVEHWPSTLFPCFILESPKMPIFSTRRECEEGHY